MYRVAHEMATNYLYGFFSFYLSLATNVIFCFKHPVVLIFVRKNFDLIKRSNVLNLFCINNGDQSPVSKQLGDSVTTLNIVDSEICLLTVKSKQLFEVDDVVSTLLVKNVARLIQFLFLSGCYTDSG